MRPRQFRPCGVDALEDRLVMTAFSVPFTLVTPPADEVNPKNLVVTKHTETQISYAITNAFNRFSHDLSNDLNSYNKAIAKPNADSAKLLAQFDSKVTSAFNRLSTDLKNVSTKLPFGGVNLNPVLQDRITGPTGVTNTATGVNTPSLQTRLTTLFDDGQTGQAAGVIHATQTFVRSDVKNYINLGVTNGDFKLGRGAIFPELS